MKNFSANGKTAFLYDVAEAKITAASARDVFCFNELHSMTNNHGDKDNNSVEDVYAIFEGKASAAEPRL